MKNAKKKKGILAAIWESMTKTGVCCGPGESCGCSATSGKSKKTTKKQEFSEINSDRGNQ